MSKTQKMHKLLPLVVTGLLLTACGDERPKLTPDPLRFERERVVAPAGEARCDDDNDGVFEPCLSQRQADNLFDEAVNALCRANDKLAWLSDYYLGTELEPSCKPLED